MYDPGSSVVTNGSTVNGYELTVIGNQNEVTGDHNTILGNDNVVEGDHCRVTGNYNTVKGKHNSVLGNHNKMIGPLVYCGAQGNDNLVNGRPVGKSFNMLGFDGTSNCIGALMTVGGPGGGVSITPARSSSPRPKKRQKKNKKKKSVSVPPEADADADRPVNEKSDEKECCICLINVTNSICLPCAHKCLCVGCARELFSKATRDEAKCPICKAGVKAVRRVFE